MAKIGCDDESGQPTLSFIREVVNYMRETSYHFRPSQLLGGVLITDATDMTADKIREHLELVSTDACQFPVDPDEDGDDFNGVTEWLSLVDPVPAGDVSMNEDGDEMMGVSSELNM